MQDGEETEIEVEGESHTTIDSMVLEPLEATNPDVVVEDMEALIDTNYAGKLKPAVEAAIKAKWGKIMGPDVEIVVSHKYRPGHHTVISTFSIYCI
jgi:LEA14-like dessication related protein